MAAEFLLKNMSRAQALFYIFTFTLGGKGLLAQIDTISLKEVSVIEKRSSKFAVGSQVFNIDSTQLISYQGQTLTEVLQFESGIYLKHYSPGNLASTSFRGGNASQTALTWNGFNINSPLNGIFDLSLFPVSAFDEVKVQPGASSALWGSGAVGGSIHLSQKPDFKPHFNVNLSTQAGSFGFHKESVGIDFGSKRFSHRLIVLNQFAKNDFDYINPFTNLKETQRNNDVETKALLSENYFNLNPKNLISLNWWYQQTDRNTPPTLFETTLANQTDDVSRLTAEWFHQLKKGELKIRGAWFSELQDYSNLTDDTSYFNNSQTFIGEAEFNRKLKRGFNVDLGFNQTSYLADVQSYKREPKWQHRQSAFAGLSKTFFSKLDASAMLRQEIIDQKTAPFTYTLGMSWKITNGLSLKGQYSKVYRTPTLNDLYWAPGGNPDLKSEEGNAQEASLVWANSKLKWNWQIVVSAFNRQIKNWIIWQPQSGIWTPQNLLEVHSRGWETNSHLQWQKGKFGFRLNLITNYTVSTNKKPSRANDASVGKQLIYVPIYSGTGGIEVKYSKFSLRYNHSYTGYTYTTSDHSEWLDPYQLGSLYMAYSPQWKKFGGSFFFRINNIWNEPYQVVRSRPMPGINYSIGLNLNFKLIHQK